MSDIATIAAFTVREALRRRIFLVVTALSVAFLALYALGVWQAFKSVEDFEVNGVQGEIVAGATLFGLAMFGTLFLGVVLAIFLTLGAVRGDAERGLLQPIVVRRISRRELLLGRLAAAATVCAAYVLMLYFATLVIVGAIGGWWPDRVIAPGVQLALGVVLVAALSLAGSIVLSSMANGIATFMVFGAGLVAGLLGQIGDALGSGTLQDVAAVASWALPFEALYQDALSDLTAETVGVTRFIIELGPLGGAAAAGPRLWIWSIAYLGLVAAAAMAAFRRADL